MSFIARPGLLRCGLAGELRTAAAAAASPSFLPDSDSRKDHASQVLRTPTTAFDQCLEAYRVCDLTCNNDGSARRRLTGSLIA